MLEEFSIHLVLVVFLFLFVLVYHVWRFKYTSEVFLFSLMCCFKVKPFVKSSTTTVHKIFETNSSFLMK